jgi:Protein of unknown function (DUF998)
MTLTVDRPVVPLRRAVPVFGLLVLVLGAGLLVVLHFVPPTNGISPVRRTISEYALGPNKWIFDASLVLVAAGSAVTFADLARRRISGWAAVLLGAVWTVSLLIIVAFVKTNWAVGPSLGGTIHRYASLAAFVSLPIAVLLAAGAVFPHSRAGRWLARGFGIMSLLWFGSILVGVVNMLAGGPAWWRFVPLGLVERVVAGCAVAALTVLVVGLARHPTAEPPPGSPEPVPVPA